LTVTEAQTSDTPQDFRLKSLTPPNFEAILCGRPFQPEIRASNLVSRPDCSACSP
jgi:hypothetical protein